MNFISLLEDAKKLAHAGEYQQAWEMLFGKAEGDVPCTKVAVAQPELELVNGDGKNRSFIGNRMKWESQGCRMMSNADLCSLLGSLTYEQLASLRNDMAESWLFTSLLHFNGLMMSVDGREQVECPEYDRVPVTEVEERVLQYFFDTADAKEAIIAKLSELFGRTPMLILFSMPSIFNRNMSPERAASLGYDGGHFHINGSSLSNLIGRSRGVRVRER